MQGKTRNNLGLWYKKFMEAEALSLVLKHVRYRLTGSGGAVVVYFIAGRGALVGGARHLGPLTADALDAVACVVRQLVPYLVFSS